MKPIVNREICIGCGTCEGICPEVFKVIDGKSNVLEMADYSAYADKIQQAVDACPVQCISTEE
ncbi:MAG: ferredoxin [Patescibacteria group bacterium]|nr:ferredoxin [Patescibacteria group bacterium]